MKRLPRRNRLSVLRCCLAAVLVGLCLIPGGALAAETSAGKVVIIAIDQIGLQELNDSGTPALKALIKRGAVGLMSVHAGSNGDMSAQYTAIGAGDKVAGILVKSNLSASATVLEGFGARERIDNRFASDIYLERTGKSAYYPKAANLSISALVIANTTGDFNGVPGALGTALRGAGLKTAVIGNSDTADAYGRSAIDLLMDETGVVDFGYLDGSTLLADPAFPSGKRTDTDKVEAMFAAAYSRADVIAVDWGDTDRVRADREFMTGGREKTLIKKSLGRADLFLQKVISEMDLSRDLLIVVAPTPSAPDIKNNRLVAPVIMAGAGINRGLLTSPSTRRQATIINTDIAPTILHHFSLAQPTEMTGRVVSGQAYDGDTLSYALAVSDSWVEVRDLMPILLRGFAYWDIFVLVLFIALLLRRRWRRWAAKGRWILLTVPALPLAFLLLPLLGYGSTTLAALEAIALVVALIALVRWQARSPMEAVGLIGLGVMATVLIDLGTGSHLMQNSLLGYSVLAGARFYGIGNEFAGVLTGAVLLGALYVVSAGGRAAGTWRKIMMLIVLAVPLAMMGAPNLGAEFGTLLADVAGFGLMALGITRGGYKIRDILSLAIMGLLGIIAFVGFDVTRGAAGGSHVGRLVTQIGAEGAAPFFTIVNRKVAMNLKLIQFAFWNWVNVVSIGVAALSFYGLRNLLELVFQRYEYVKAALVGGLFCCIGALVLNDSGVVTMAMILLYLVPALLFLMSYELGDEAGGL